MAETEDFVGLTYRGMPLAERARIFDFGPTTAYVETEEPMPVGTALLATSDSSLEIQLEVATVQEKVSGHEGPVGMRVRAVSLEGEAARWWAERKSIEDPAPAAVAGEVARAGDGPHRGDGTVELEDDGKVTQAIDVRAARNEGEATEASTEAPVADEATEATTEAPVDDEATAATTGAPVADEATATSAEESPAGDEGEDARADAAEKPKRRRASRKAREADGGGAEAEAEAGKKKKRRGRRKKKT